MDKAESTKVCDENSARKLAELRAEILLGYKQAERGESKPLDIESIEARGREKLESIGETSPLFPMHMKSIVKRPSKSYYRATR